MAVGIGAVLVSGTTAAVPADKAGLAAGLLSASQQLGTALGLAIFSAMATARTRALLAAHAPRDAALTAGFHRALLACAIFLLAAAVIALRAATAAVNPPRPAAPTPSPARSPRWNWPTRPRPRQPRVARQRTASRRPLVKKARRSR
jgi:hypothetical protein